MRLGQIQNRKMVTEGFGNPELTLFEQRVITPWVASVEQVIFEAELSQDQITGIFKSVEQNASNNRTLAGKAVDIAKLPVEAVKKIDDLINQLGGMVQKAGPIKNADAEFEKLKQQITANNKDSKIVQAIQGVSNWAKENPGKASIAVAILTAAAALAAGPAGGAVAGFIARATKDLLQGQKLSTAVGKSIKTAAYGALAGAAIQGLTDNIIGNIATGSEAEANAMMDGFEKANFTAAVDKAVADAGFAKGALDGAMNYSSEGNINGFFYNYNFTMTPDQVDTYKQLLDKTLSVKTFSPEYYEAAGKLHGFLSTAQQANADLTALARTVADIPKDMLTGDQLDAAIAVLDNADAAIEKIMDVGGGAAAAAQGALQTVDADNKQMHKVKPISPQEKAELEGGAKESKVYAGQKLSEGQIYLLFNRLEKVNTHMLENKLMFESVFDALSHHNKQTINEGPFDAIKKAASAVGGFMKGAGKQITTKVTAEKLMSAWKKANSPTDSAAVYDVIKGLGVADDVIKGTYDSMKIETPKATDAPDADKDQTAADSETNADEPTDQTAGDSGSDTSTTGAADVNAGGDEPAATDDTGDTTSPKKERYYLQKNTKDETKVDIIDKQTSKPIKNGVALEPEKAEPMSDKMNKEVGKFEPKTGERYKMQPNQQNPKTYDVIDTQTDQPVEKGAGLQPGDAEEMRDELNSAKAANTQQTSTTSTQDTTNTGTTDTDTASTSGGQQPDATTGPTDQVDANNDGLDDKTGNPVASNRGDGQGQNTTAPQQTPAPVDIKALASEIKKLGPDAVKDAKNLLAA